MYSLDFREIRSHVKHHLPSNTCDWNNIVVADGVVLQFQSICVCRWIRIFDLSWENAKSAEWFF